MAGFDTSNASNREGRKGFGITDTSALAFTGKMGASQGDYIHVDTWGNLNPPAGPVTSTWFVETATATKDLKALYPTATAFEFKVVGAGGGGCGSYMRQINTQSSNNNAGGSGGGYSTAVIPVASITGAVTVTVGAGGAGGLPATTTATWGYAGVSGTESSVAVGATNLLVAKGGNYGGFGSTMWPYGGVGTTLKGGEQAGTTGTSATSPLHGTTCSIKAVGTSPPAMPTSTSTGCGGAFAGFTTSTATRAGQPGQNASTGALGGATGAMNTNDVILGAGSVGGAGSALTDGTLNFGGGGGSGGMGSNNNTKGGNGGAGGWPGGGGGAAGPSTLVAGGSGGAGANGVVMWRPVF